MSKASQDELAELHAIVAKKLKAMVQNPDATPQDIAQAIKFLKDNSIAADLEFSKPLTELEKAVNAKTLPFSVS
jgi:hypothetical protein